MTKSPAKSILAGLLVAIAVDLQAPLYAQKTIESDYIRQRQRMVTEQIEGRGIKSPAVLRALRKVERHRFVPPEYVAAAYGDFPLPIGYGQTISQPYIVALMTELLAIKAGDKVLEIGTGSGYQAAVLAELCDSVFSVEIVPELSQTADRLLKRLGYRNILVRTGDGYRGWSEHAPYDGIIVTCAPTAVPLPLQEQLVEGGRMVIPVGESYTQELIVLTKHRGKLQRQSVIPVRFVPMLREDGRKY